ncbi:MAG: hypothetical protein HY319_10955, partial [Armatimonadetes bacterium]|nr:hypothetical protein [Armatimonadota bacterium]
MRTVAVIAWLVVLTGSAGAIEVEVVASAPHGLFYLLECLREEPHHSQQLREVFRARHPLSSEEESALADYRALMEGRWANLTFPATEIQERSLAHVLEVLAVRADSVPHFLEDARALLGPADSAVLTRACKLLEPSYRQLVWESSRPDLERQIGELKAQFEHGGANDRLQQAARFYESRWPADQGFLVVLTPVPREPGQKIVTHGHSNGHLQVVEAASGATQREAASVVFHELCHALYGTRAPEAEQELVGWFAGDSYPYQQLNEALATAVGNAWFHRLLTGDVPSKPWYHDTYVDGYAREVYPLVEEYLHEGRSLDELFAARAAAAFAARFPQAGHDPALVLRRVLLLALDE